MNIFVEKFKSLFLKKKDAIEVDYIADDEDNVIDSDQYNPESEAPSEMDNSPEHLIFNNTPIQSTEKVKHSLPAQIVSTIEWDSLYRSAQDGGANSVLACHVLKKSMELLTEGNEQVASMVNVAREVQQDTVELKAMAESIHDISKASRMISINLAIEAARFNEDGAAFNVVAEEMRKLSDLIGEHSHFVEKKIQLVQERTLANENMCREVSMLFSNTNRELVQFRNLMMRVEELSTTQNEKLKKLEKKISGEL